MPDNDDDDFESRKPTVPNSRERQIPSVNDKNIGIGQLLKESDEREKRIFKR
jgi:hypothetical protein|tara:strand:- start:769 stop:924 length:156 start_codon:yes stop_codon:yes gene_type:complete